jgi:hypothetical protein
MLEARLVDGSGTIYVASETFLFVVAHIFILNRENFIHHGSTIFVAVHSNQI